MQIDGHSPHVEAHDQKRRRLLQRPDGQSAAASSVAISTWPSRCKQVAKRKKELKSSTSYHCPDVDPPHQRADMPIHVRDSEGFELAENLEDALELSNQLTLYITFLQSKVDDMLKEAMHEARPEVLHTIAQRMYAEWRARANSGPTPVPARASSGNETNTDALPPCTNNRTRREARLLTVWGWDRTPHRAFTSSAQNSSS